MKNRLATATIAALLFSTAAFAHSAKVGDLEIMHPYIPATTGSAMSAAGYFDIENASHHADKLIGIEADFAEKAMLHTTTVDANGVAVMSHVEALDVPGETTVTMEPGGYHIMLMGLKMPLVEGAYLPATLIFENAGRVGVEFKVEPKGEEMDHSTMDQPKQSN